MRPRIDMDAIEARARKMAHSLPPSDLGSTRAIQAIASFVAAEIEADRGAVRESEAAR